MGHGVGTGTWSEDTSSGMGWETCCRGVGHMVGLWDVGPGARGPWRRGRGQGHELEPNNLTQPLRAPATR